MAYGQRLSKSSACRKKAVRKRRFPARQALLSVAFPLASARQTIFSCFIFSEIIVMNVSKESSWASSSCHTASTKCSFCKSVTVWSGAFRPLSSKACKALMRLSSASPSRMVYFLSSHDMNVVLSGNPRLLGLSCDTVTKRGFLKGFL